MTSLTLTKYNDIVLTANSDDPNFKGITFSSSDTKLLDFEKIDDTSVRLKFVKNFVDMKNPPSVTITAKAGENSQSFNITVQDYVILKGIRVKFGDQQFIAKQKPYMEFDPTSEDAMTLLYVEANKDLKEAGETRQMYHMVNETTEPTIFEIVDLEPENASFRFVKDFKHEEICFFAPPILSNKISDTTAEIGLPPYCTEADQMVDFSFIQGRKAGVQQSGAIIMYLNIIGYTNEPDTMTDLNTTNLNTYFVSVLNCI